MAGPIVRSVIDAQRFAELAERPAYADLWYATIQSGDFYRALRRNVMQERSEAQHVFLLLDLTQAFAAEIAAFDCLESDRLGVGASVTPPLSLMGETPSC